MTVARGRPGVAAVCSTHESALAVASSAAAAFPSSLTVYLGCDSGVCVVTSTGDVPALTRAMSASADISLHHTMTRSLLRHRRTWDIGTPTPGPTLLYLTRARPGLSSDDYHRYWERQHGPIALRHHLGLWDYAQVSVLETLRGEHVDGIAVTQWPRMEDLAERADDGALGRSIINADAARFTDISHLERHLMREWIHVEEPWPNEGSLEIADSRHLVFDRPVDDVWPLVGRFDALLEWWPRGFTACTTSSDMAVGMTRVLTRDDGSHVVERLIDYRPEERMLQLAVDEGLPQSVNSYTCRYEIRPAAEGESRLDWYPRGVVRSDATDVFAAMVDRGWARISDGLSGAVSRMRHP